MTRIPSVTAEGTATRDPRADHGAPLRVEYRPHGSVDLMQTVAVHRRGPGDPTCAVDQLGAVWRVTRTPEGVATLVLTARSGAVHGAAWGPGADWAAAQVPALCGAADDLDGFDPSAHPVVARAHHRTPGLRLGRTDRVFDALAAAIIEQKVTAVQAFAAWRRIVTWHGERAPGPTPRPMFAPPTVEDWTRIPSWAWHRAGVEPPQSRTIVRAAGRGRTLPAALDAADAGGRERILTALPGVGPWTAAETAIRAYGDPDAVSVGDYHLAHAVGYALTGSRTDDDGMLALLAPWAGHRQRVIRLLAASGPREPRRGPRLHPEDHRGR
jgi:3-methyladenine DNA glycosylase/8-oxoguanine DNA glycosylase